MHDFEQALLSSPPSTSVHLYPPQDVVLTSMLHATVAGYIRILLPASMQDPANELRRIPIPRTRVNKAREEPDADRQRHQALLRCACQLAESPLDAVGQLASPVLLSHGDLLGRYVPHGGSSCPRCWTSTPRTLSARADEAGGPPSQVLRATGHARLPLLQLPLQPPFFRFNERHHRATSALSTDEP